MKKKLLLIGAAFALILNLSSCYVEVEGGRRHHHMWWHRHHHHEHVERVEIERH